MRIRTYSELRSLNGFEDRLNYLKLNGEVGKDTFGFDRHINQMFYKSKEWKYVRNKVILRDNGCDLGIPDHEIYESVYIHHINPITVNDIDEVTEYLLNPEYLITCSFRTHNAIHYGTNENTVSTKYVERRPNDTCLWKH